MHILAADPTNPLWTSSLGDPIKAVLGAVGMIVIIYAVFKAIKEALSGSVGKAAKTVISGAVIAAFMLNPPMLGSLINTVSNVVSKVISGTGDVVDGGSTSTTGGTVDTGTAGTSGTTTAP